jgi:uncharacterized membrane protein (UPF0127 family)
MLRLLGICLGMIGMPVSGFAAQLACPDLDVAFHDERGSRTTGFTTYLADDPEEQRQGLMNVDHLPANEAMLFDFGEERRVGFWMKDTLIPLDMIFMDGGGTVLDIHMNATPGDETTIVSPYGTRFVLEVNGGQTSTRGIKPGHVIRTSRLQEKCLKRF